MLVIYERKVFITRATEACIINLFTVIKIT